MTTHSTPPRPLCSSDVAWEEWFDVPRFGVRYRHLSRAAIGDDYRVGVAIEELLPGRQSSPAHYHIFEEEHVFILEGTLTARVGAHRYPMKTGDYLCFPAGQKAGHCLINDSDAVCRYVIVGENNPNEVAVYTDTHKVLVRALGRRAIFDMAAMRSYWEGENTGLPAGAKLPADEVTSPSSLQDEPRPPISADSVDWDEEGVPGSTRFGGRSKHLTHAAVGDGYRVGMIIEAPAPGMRLAPKHYHLLEEEHALILEGQVTLLMGAERHDMSAGDYVCFPAGLQIGHSFMNSGKGPCSYLMIGEHHPDDVRIYPDSNKIAVQALRTREAIFDMAQVKGYWDGEEAS